tara:strand:- start:313 stop:756 length:444 start_codon:yes stop_codon:yes gene_type:complete
MKILKHTFKIKPLSANQMTYRNKAIKQIKYVEYQNEIRDELAGVKWPFASSTLLEFEIIAGVSNKAADLDNVVKPILDTYQSIFEEFNDNKVYHIKLHKQMTAKGNEYLYVKVERWIDALALAVVNDKELLERTVHVRVHTNSMPRM